jgi:hypothetical protein
MMAWLRLVFLVVLVLNVCWLGFLEWVNDHE